ncbi:hypothetical protein LRY65_03545 [Candidatus Woesebacteria bacterium]|nr:hypothetical protein [Candidatus Woesebacteria bacterium]MCD8527258.1 hypothetical protein [Candidatus Woesebacteria bacterium]MCD8546625.1 hypothetical protein [Candidatus Woesebacteria bacterium]
MNPNLPRVRLGRFCQQHEYRKFAYDEIHSKVLPDLKKIVLENEQAIISVFAAIMKNEQKTGMRLRSLKDNNLPSKRYLQAWAYFFNAYYFPEKNAQSAEPILKAREQYAELFTVTDQLMDILSQTMTELLYTQPSFHNFPQKRRDLNRTWKEKILPLLKEASKVTPETGQASFESSLIKVVVSNELAGFPIGHEARLMTFVYLAYEIKGINKLSTIPEDVQEFLAFLKAQYQIDNNRIQKKTS